ncbi:hypothetical protein T484DRAFT_1743090 [Baffinella frigidus]|nr:hypothetical protein T484DRAFT_1743090 [Cryptophyta sp. CCMP2293]
MTGEILHQEKPQIGRRPYKGVVTSRKGQTATAPPLNDFTMTKPGIICTRNASNRATVVQCSQKVRGGKDRNRPPAKRLYDGSSGGEFDPGKPQIGRRPYNRVVTSGEGKTTTTPPLDDFTMTKPGRVCTRKAFNRATVVQKSGHVQGGKDRKRAASTSAASASICEQDDAKS